MVPNCLLFVIFKGIPGRRIEKQLPQILPNGIHGCVQEKGWMDEHTMEIWFHEIWQPYVEGHGNGQKSLLLLDEMK